MSKFSILCKKHSRVNYGLQWELLTCTCNTLYLVSTTGWLSIYQSSHQTCWTVGNSCSQASRSFLSVQVVWQACLPVVLLFHSSPRNILTWASSWLSSWSCRWFALFCSSRSNSSKGEARLVSCVHTHQHSNREKTDKFRSFIYDPSLGQMHKTWLHAECIGVGSGDSNPAVDPLACMHLIKADERVDVWAERTENVITEQKTNPAGAHMGECMKVYTLYVCPGSSSHIKQQQNRMSFLWSKCWI